MSSICHGARWDWTTSHPHVSHWGDVRVGQQDAGDNPHNVFADRRLQQTDVNHLGELLHHRLQLGVAQLVVAAQLVLHQLLDQVHHFSCIVWWNGAEGRVNRELKQRGLNSCKVF